MNQIELIIKDIISGHYEYLSQGERERTEREKAIAAIKKSTLELEAELVMNRKYFESAMREREILFQSALEVIDKAIETGDVEFAEIAMRVIEICGMKNPFSF